MAALVIVSVAFRAEALSRLTTPQHDEAVSYIEATCHQSEYEAIAMSGDAPFARWTTAASWQRLWAVEDRFCFRRIGGDLARTDIHPPLYFWLLHLWLVASGVTVRSGATLNVLFSTVTILLLYGLARHLSQSRAAASVSVLVWALSPSALAITMLARQYELLALLTVAFCWQSLRISDPERRPAAWELLLLGLTVTAGLLTYYHFLVLVVAGALVVAWRLRRSPGKRLLALATATLAGSLLAAWLHPEFLASVIRMRESAESFEWFGVQRRALRVGGRLAEFGGLGASRMVWAAAAMWAAAALAAASQHRTRLALDERTTSMIALTALLLGAIAGLYVSYVTPVHAMGSSRYLAMVWPLLALIVVGMLWRSRGGRLLAVALCIAVLLGAVSWKRELGGAEANLLPDGPQPLLVDTVRRGLLPRVLWQLAPSSAVYAADQTYLLEHRDEWLEGLGDRAVFVSAPYYENSQEGRHRLLEAMSREYTVIDGPRHSSTSSSFFLRRLGTAAGSP